MIKTNLADKLAIVPKQTGCYLWINAQQEIIYVGKAKNLFHRTHSYFTKGLNQRTQKMVQEIADLKYIIVNSENQALILESDLIKKHQPKYNLLLRENSGYPLLFLTNEPQPQLIYTKRQIRNVKGIYFGPFAVSKTKPYEIYQLLNKILPIKDCKHKWNLECFKCEILKRTKIPLLAPHQQNFKAISKLINNLLKGKTAKLMAQLEKQEEIAKNLLAYEEAAKLVKIQKALRALTDSQSLKITQTNRDFIGYDHNDDEIAIIIFGLVDGKLVAKLEIVVEYLVSWQDVLANCIYEYYRNNPIPKKVFCWKINEKLQFVKNNLKINFLIPQRGEMVRWLNLATTNAQVALKRVSLQFFKKQEQGKKFNQELKTFLQLEKLVRIEAFDVSQLFGTNRVGTMVVFTNGLPDYHSYRKYLIKNERAIADTTCFQEILSRRCQQLLTKNSPIPDLIVLDGGMAHHNLMVKCLNDYQLTIPFIALVKNHRHQTESLIYQHKKIKLNQNSDIYLFLAKIQNEVHRYAINFFRKKNLQSQMVSVLKTVKGLGNKKIAKLISKYDNILALKNASLAELKEIINFQTAVNLKQKLATIQTENQRLNQIINKQ